MRQEKSTLNLKTEITQNLEGELLLQELKDSLEHYREAREDLISEIAMDSLRQLTEDQIPENLGEEMPEVDSVISQLDTTITACDTALIIKEIGD